MPAQDRPPSFYAPLPPITPASYGLGPSFKAQRSNRPTWRKILSLTPIFFVLGLLLYPYIPFVYLLSYHATYSQRGRPLHAAYQLVSFHFLLGMTIWSYLSAWSTPPGSPLEDDVAAGTGDEEEGIGMMEMLDGEGGRSGRGGVREGLLSGEEGGRDVELDGLGGRVMAKSTNGGIRWCRKCNVAKPDRCHHCSTCHRCILKMDHHCLWLGTCIGQKNYRSFLLFLTYTSLYSLLVGVEAFRTVWAFFDESDAMTEVDFTPVSHLILLIMGFAFTLSIGGFCLYHWWLCLHNETTLESMISTRTPPSLALPPSPTLTASLRWRPERNAGLSNINVWDLGWKKNLLSLAPGSRRSSSLLWFFVPSPVGASGLSFDADPAKVSRLRERTRVIRLGEDPQRERAEQDRWGEDPQRFGEDDEEDEDEDDEEEAGDQREGRVKAERDGGGGGRGKGWDTRSNRMST